MIDELKVKCQFCGEMSFTPIYDQTNNFYVCQKCCKICGHAPPFTKEELLIIYQYLIDEVRSGAKRKLMYGI